MLPTITPDKIDLPPGTMLHFPGTLADYEQILVQLGDRAIPEVWIYQKGELNIYQFVDNSYLATDTSRIFPDFPVKQTIPQYVNRAWEVVSSVALREFSQILP